MPTLFEKIIAAGLPISDAKEDGSVTGTTGIELTEEQEDILRDIILEHTRPSEYSEISESRTNIKMLKASYLSSISRLQQIQKASNMSNAQIIAAIKDMALIQERTLKLIKKMLF